MALLTAPGQNGVIHWAPVWLNPSLRTAVCYHVRFCEFQFELPDGVFATQCKTCDSECVAVEVSQWETWLLLFFLLRKKKAWPNVQGERPERVSLWCCNRTEQYHWTSVSYMHLDTCAGWITKIGRDIWVPCVCTHAVNERKNRAW